ncbi:MAG: V-type ATP synthase subunit I [Deltaproteobacteria bacterium]
MELLSMVVYKDKVEEVISRLLKLGIFHPVDIRHIESALSDLSPFQVEKEYVEWEALEISLREISRKLSLGAYPVAKDIRDLSYEKVKDMLSGIDDRIKPLAEKKEDLSGELKTRESIFAQIKEYFPLQIKRGSFYTFLEVVLGKIEEKNIPALERSLKEIPHLVYPFNREEAGKVTALVIGLRRDRILINKVLKDLSWERVEYPQETQGLSGDVEKKIKIQIEECKKEIAEVDKEIKNVAQASSESLSQARSFIVLNKSLLEAKKYSCITEKTMLLSGWVPREDKEKVISEIRRIDPSFYIEERRPEEVDIPKEEIPVRLKHNPFLKPFELLVDSYGLPRYGTIDPTIFVAISFLVMFGAMFGDLGQGLVLMLSGLFMKKSGKPSFRQASVLIFYCGTSAAIFGILYGSFFGIEFPSVWLKPMRDIMEFFRISVFFGMGVITLGILLNIINALRDRDYIKAIFDKAGLIVGIIYWIAIGIITKYLVYRIPASPLFLSIVAFGLLLIFFRPAIEFIFKEKKENVRISFLESTVEIFEILMGYLSNTVSFMRIAAYAITHASLFVVVFELSRGLKGAALVGIILGNILIILLEGLIASVQSLRLNYYEFFSKFFISGKEVYKPLTGAIKE